MEIKKKLDEWSSEAVKVADMANGYSKSDEADIPDPDFHDFDIERSEKCFKEGQLWAAYDDRDGMPQNYAIVHK
ncbi:DnaJ domain-containing protein, partial [Tanacetum coccineum]